VNAERFRTNVFVATLLSALALCVALFSPFWPALAWAVVLAILIYPTHRRIQGRVKSSGIAAGLSTLLTIALVVVPLALILLAMIAEGNSLVQRTRVALGNETWQQQIDKIETAVQTHIGRLSGGVIDLKHVDLVKMTEGQLGRAASLISERASDFVGKIGRNFVQVGLSFVTLFFIFKDGSRLLPAVKAFIPLDEEQTNTGSFQGG
jgi:predicted PurR-regulated permease PerM